MQSRNSNNLTGIDVSHHQGNIDFSKIKAAGIRVVYMKATESTNFTDPSLDTNYKNAKANGLKVGFYHFFRAKTEDNARQQAQYFVNTIKNYDYDCRLALDIETAEGLNKDTLSKLAKIFIDEVNRFIGKDVSVLYTYTSFANSNLTSIVKDYPLWIAHYGVNTPGNNPIWNSWTGFQYSDAGKINGISGDIDMDEFTQDILIKEVPMNISYQGQVQNVGWQNTAVNGQEAGTEGKGLRLEALAINSDVPLTFSGHVQDIGWQTDRHNGEVIGTIGRGLRLEAIKITSNDPKYSVVYQVHVQDIGWMPEVKDGAVAGTTGQGKRIEAIKIKLINK